MHARQALVTLVLSQFLLPFDVLLRFTSEICESGNGNLSLDHTATTATLIPMHNVFTTVFYCFTGEYAIGSLLMYCE